MEICTKCNNHKKLFIIDDNKNVGYEPCVYCGSKPIHTNTLTRYVLYNKNENVYLGDEGETSENVNMAVRFITCQYAIKERRCCDLPEDWEIRMIKITYEVF